MFVDRSKFLIMTGMLASGGLGSLACDRFANADRSAPPPVAAPTANALPALPTAVEIIEPVALPGAPVCDDSLGTPEECPSVGPSDEGVCPNLLFKRCGDFKVAMKPRVAAQAVACLRALKGNERCDSTRINQCGHAALMSACPEPTRPKKGQLQVSTSANGAQLATVTITPDTTPDPSPVAAACNNVMRSCGERSLGPSLADCRQTLAGMTESGRLNMVDCVSAHCLDRGLYGCEAMPRDATAQQR